MVVDVGDQTVKTVANILKLLSTHFVANIDVATPTRSRPNPYRTQSEPNPYQVQKWTLFYVDLDLTESKKYNLV